MSPEFHNQGSVIATADAAGDVDQIYTYSSFGVPGEQGASLFRYTGQVWDEEAQLAYYKARYYSPERGRFLSTDPAGFVDSMNLYSYVVNDPVNFNDPNGEFLVNPNTVGAVFGGISGGIGAYIASGGDLKETLYGVGVGAAFGLASPATAISNAAIGFVSSLAGQTIGSGSIKNLDIGLAAASALGGVGSRGLTQFLANANRSAAAHVITRALGPTRPAAVNTFNAVTDGILGGSVELAYQNLGPTGPATATRPATVNTLNTNSILGGSVGSTYQNLK